MSSTEAESQKRLKRFAVRVVSVERPSSGLVLLTLERPSRESFDFEAGQFLYLFGAGPSDRWAFSIASAPHETQRIDLAIAPSDEGSMLVFLAGLRTGSTVEVSAAFGAFRFRSPPRRGVVLIGAETGIAPLRSVIRELAVAGDPRPVTVVHGARAPENLAFRHEFEALVRDRPNFHYVPLVTKALPAALVGLNLPWSELDAYVSGVRAAVDPIVAWLVEKGLPRSRIHTERFG